LRRITYGGSPMPLELLKKGLQKWGHLRSGLWYDRSGTSPHYA
jgi:hypothetical protein